MTNGYTNTSQTPTQRPARTDGTTVVIEYHGTAAGWYHTTVADPIGYRPQVVFSKDGLALGCTFITTLALKALVDAYTEFQKGSRVLQ